MDSAHQHNETRKEDGVGMRIRSTKPEFWRSKTIAQFDWETRLVLKALESYVDDNGVGKDSVVIFCADAFPHDLAKSPEICAKVSRSLDRLSEAGLIVRYTVDGEDLLYIRRWKQWQYIDKPKAGRFPRPDGSMNYRDEVNESIGAGQYRFDPDTSKLIREDSPELPENFANISSGYPQIQSGEQGNRGSEDQEKEGGYVSLVSHQSDDPEPPLFCSLHPNGTAKPCRGCGAASDTHKAWTQREAAREAARREAFKAELAACHCDENGFIEDRTDSLKRCPNHDWSRTVA